LAVGFLGVETVTTELTTKASVSLKKRNIYGFTPWCETLKTVAIELTILCFSSFKNGKYWRLDSLVVETVVTELEY
jgi:hypothetical protein